MCACSVTSVVSNSLQPYRLEPARLLCPWGFSSQEFWSGLPLGSPGHLPDPGIEPVSLMTSALAGGIFTTSTTWEVLAPVYTSLKWNWQQQLYVLANGFDTIFKWWIWKYFVNCKSVSHKFKVTLMQRTVTIQQTHILMSVFSPETQLLHFYIYYTYTNILYIF